MTLVRFKNKPLDRSFNNFIDDLLPQFPSILSDDFATGFRQIAPVNIKQTENSYLLEIIAPGFERDDFKIGLDNNNLTITGEKKAEAENQNEKNIRKEYKYQSFKRSFTVDENIDAENISAKYVNGVLTLNLPKREEVKAATKEISIQ